MTTYSRRPIAMVQCKMHGVTNCRGITRSGVTLQLAHGNDLPQAKKHVWCARSRAMVWRTSKPLHVPVSLRQTRSLKREAT